MTTKHLHLPTDRKKILAHEIYNETVYLLELQKELNLALTTVQSIDLNYTDSIILCKKIRSINSSIKKTWVLIEELQKEHDSIND